jgi:plastocyanin
MRFSAFALAASVIVLGACGGKDKEGAANTTDTTAAAPAPATGTEGASAGAAAGGAAAGGAATAQAATGTTHEVKMLGDEKGYRFEPANITVKQGDAIKFTMVSGGPHNVAFDAAALPAAGTCQLRRPTSPTR